MIIILNVETQLIYRLMYFGNTALILAVGRDKNREYRQLPALSRSDTCCLPPPITSSAYTFLSHFSCVSEPVS